MIEKKYVSKSGKEGSNWKLEKGDEFVFKEFKSYPGKFGKNCFCVTTDDKWISLTGGQASFFERFNVKEGTKLGTEPYTNDFGTFLGIRDLSSNKLVQKSSTKLPSLDKPVEADLTSDEETCINQLAQNEEYSEWKDYAKVNETQLLEAMKGVGEKIGLTIGLNGERLTKAHKLFLTKI